MVIILNTQAHARQQTPALRNLFLKCLSWVYLISTQLPLKHSKTTIHSAKIALLRSYSLWKNTNLARTYVRNNSVSFGLISDRSWYAPAADWAGLCAEIKCHFSLMCLVSSVILWKNSDSRVIERELNIDTDIVTREWWVHSSFIDSSAVVFSQELNLQWHRLTQLTTVPITSLAQAWCSGVILMIV